MLRERSSPPKPRNKHATFMQVFVDWLDKQPGTEVPKRSFDVATLYATAFEFTAIGASAAS